MTNARIGAARELRSRREYEELHRRLPTMTEEVLSITPVPGGLLEREDELTRYSPLSYQVKWQLQLTAQHLRAFDQMVEPGLPPPAVAGYPLIRAAIEAAAQAHWLLQNGKRAQRVLRALRSSWWDHSDAMVISRSLGQPDPEWDRKTREALERGRLEVKELAQASLDVPRLSHSDMLTDVERHLKLPMPTPLIAWRLCSSLTHGNSLVASMALQRQVIDLAAPQLHTATSSWTIVSPLIRTTLATFDAAATLFGSRAAASAANASST